MNSDNYKGGFRELEAWKEARIFKQQIIEDCKNFPKEEKFLLTAQLKDSSRSVTANIAEGYGRYNYQETSQFFRQSRGSLNESLDHLIKKNSQGLAPGPTKLKVFRRFDKWQRLYQNLTM